MSRYCAYDATTTSEKEDGRARGRAGDDGVALGFPLLCRGPRDLGLPARPERRPVLEGHGRVVPVVVGLALPVACGGPRIGGRHSAVDAAGSAPEGRHGVADEHDHLVDAPAAERVQAPEVGPGPRGRPCVQQSGGAPRRVGLDRRVPARSAVGANGRNEVTFAAPPRRPRQAPSPATSSHSWGMTLAMWPSRYRLPVGAPPACSKSWRTHVFPLPGNE